MMDKIIEEYETDEEDSVAVASAIDEHLDVVKEQEYLKHPYSVTILWLDSSEISVDLLVKVLVECDTKRDAQQVEKAIKNGNLDELDYPVLLMSSSLVLRKIEYRTRTTELNSVKKEIKRELYNLLRYECGWEDKDFVDYEISVVDRLCKTDQD